jgi:pre-mRNA-processing factor 6
MAKAMQECPTSGLLWAETVDTCSKNEQKRRWVYRSGCVMNSSLCNCSRRSQDAIKKCDNDPIVITAVAKLFAKVGNWHAYIVRQL